MGDCLFAVSITFYKHENTETFLCKQIISENIYKVATIARALFCSCRLGTTVQNFSTVFKWCFVLVYWHAQLSISDRLCSNFCAVDTNISASIYDQPYTHTTDRRSGVKGQAAQLSSAQLDAFKLKPERWDERSWPSSHADHSILHWPKETNLWKKNVMKIGWKFFSKMWRSFLETSHFGWKKMSWLAKLGACKTRWTASSFMQPPAKYVL